MKIKDILFPGIDVYEGLDSDVKIREGEKGCFDRNLWLELIKDLDREKELKLMEIGCRYSYGANALANFLKSENFKFEIISVDTFLGSQIHFENNKHELKLVHGFPTYYYDALKITKYYKNEDYIVLFPQTSISACKFFKDKTINFDFIIVDGSHEMLDVYFDLLNSWEILKPGGTIIGDDLFFGDGSVKAGLEMFLRLQGLTYEKTQWQYVIRKK